MNRHSFSAALLLLAAALFLSPGRLMTGSFLTADDSVRNTMYVGENITEIEEDFDPPPEAVPGESFVKSPRVRNIGNTPCTVRVRIDFSDSEAEALCEPLVICSGWIASPDGFLYWHEPLYPGEATDPVFEYIRFKSDADSGELSEAFNKGFRVYVYAESMTGGFD